MNEYLSGCLLFPLFVLNVNKEKKKTTHTDEGTSTEYPKSTPCYRTEGQICDTQQSERRQKECCLLVKQSRCAFVRHLSSLLGSPSC